MLAGIVREGLVRLMLQFVTDFLDHISEAVQHLPDTEAIDMIDVITRAKGTTCS